jgi:hypothetical protein
MPSSPVPEPSPGVGTSPQPQVAPAPPSGARPLAKPDALPPSRVTGEFNVLCYTLLSLFVICFGVWVIFAWMDYGKRYAPLADGWYAGGTRSIEITLVRDDTNNLDCASDVVVEGLHCAYRADQQPFEPGGTNEPVRLRPYNTVDQVVFLGAGLWSSPGLSGPLPSERFTVTCNFRMVSTIRSVATRWAAGGAFTSGKNALPAGVLSDCVIPR